MPKKPPAATSLSSRREKGLVRFLVCRPFPEFHRWNVGFIPNAASPWIDSRAKSWHLFTRIFQCEPQPLSSIQLYSDAEDQNNHLLLVLVDLGFFLIPAFCRSMFSGLFLVKSLTELSLLSESSASAPPASFPLGFN